MLADAVDRELRDFFVERVTRRQDRDDSHDRARNEYDRERPLIAVHGVAPVREGAYPAA